MVGCLFAGQGSQYVGMGKDLYDAFPEAKAVFDQAQKTLGFDLKTYCFEGPAEMLKLTNISQPAIVTVSLAAYQAFKSKTNLQPKYMAGLSLGEYSALIASGAMPLEDGLRLIRRRGEIMEEASRRNPGKMAAVLDLALEELKKICVISGAEIANFNAPGQVVITGKKEAVDKARELCVAAGAKRVIELEVSGGFHSALMFPASADLKTVIANTPMTAPDVPVISNYTARPQFKVVQIEENLVYQLYSSVQWEGSMRFMLGQGITQFYEFGPGKVLKGLMRRIESNAQVTAIEKKDDILAFS